MKQLLTRKTTTLMIVLGWLLVFWGVTNALAEYKRNNSPFDDPGYGQLEDNQGFAPYLNPIAESGLGEQHAPNISYSVSAAQQTQSNSSVEKNIIIDGFDAGVQLDRGVSNSGSAISPSGEISTTQEIITRVQIPKRILISAIDLDVEIVPVNYKEIEYLGDTYQQWVAPNMYAVGWHVASAPLDEGGNTVLNGHHNVYGEVFGRLVELKNGDMIQVLSDNMRITYVVANTMILKERFQSVETRMENARWIQPSDDERLTLITCWPYESNTHRVIVVATPVSKEYLGISDKQH